MCSSELVMMGSLQQLGGVCLGRGIHDVEQQVWKRSLRNLDMHDKLAAWNLNVDVHWPSYWRDKWAWHVHSQQEAAYRAFAEAAPCSACTC